MGTRGCVGWTFTGKTYKETYNQYDSYPEYMGIRVLVMVKQLDLDVLKKNLKAIVPLKQNDPATDEHKKMYSKYMEDPNGMGKSMDNYWLFHSLQGVALLPEVAAGNIKHFPIVKDWMKDSLFCEYAYTLNFKTNELEMWKGFQHDKNDYDKYLPCKKVGTIAFADIKASTSASEVFTRMAKMYDDKADAEDTWETTLGSIEKEFGDVFLGKAVYLDGKIIDVEQYNNQYNIKFD